jgi:aryl-phospho-beta-D-glucosidase BglC (GH1 family)
VEVNNLLEQSAKADLSVLEDYVPRLIRYYKNVELITISEMKYAQESFQRFMYLRFYLSGKDLEKFNKCVEKLVDFFTHMSEIIRKEIKNEPNIEIFRR